ncbi:MAG TPA: type II secretion system protein, partial [Anaeromyxobacteraceae bacterium]|nr:type II secretion system protein [Anaeromyxobacteraceae bacterium]
APGRTTIERDPEKAKERTNGDVGGAAGVPAGGFASFDDPIVRKRELPGETVFKAIRIDGREPSTEGGPAYVHFFPGGRAQSARVTIADGGHVFTIRLEPFTGRARVTAGEPEERDE